MKYPASHLTPFPPAFPGKSARKTREPTKISARALTLRLSTFRMNTCKSVSKQRTLSTSRMNTYAKTGGGGCYCQLAEPFPGSLIHYPLPTIHYPLRSLLSPLSTAFTPNRLLSPLSTVFTHPHPGGGSPIVFQLSTFNFRLLPARYQFVPLPFNFQPSTFNPPPPASTKQSRWRKIATTTAP